MTTIELPTAGSRRKGKKSRKVGRNKIKCAAYRATNRRLHNKKRKMTKHLRHHPNDIAAARRLSEL